MGPENSAKSKEAPDQAAVAERAVDRPLQLDRIDAVRHPIEGEADVALAELRFATELAWSKLEIADLDLDHDGMAGLPGAVAGRDYSDRWLAGHVWRRRLRGRAFLATAQRQHGSDDHCGGGDNDESGASRLHDWREP